MQRKIVNDPVYGFITIDHPLLFKIIEHPYYQRLRRIHQMALAQLVYPGAVHTRLHHSLGAYHLMRFALFELKQKGINITEEEELAAKAAILLHDIGHGPYSHALEGLLLEAVHHEDISLAIMHEMNIAFDGALDLTILIFTNQYHKKFLHQLVSGQLDVDRMDYLNRDSFFTGVSEGTIAYDRILKMITVHHGELMIEEKAIFSIEKFLIARRLMYWQVYLHKTVLVAENLLKKIIIRAKQIKARAATDALRQVLEVKPNTDIQDILPIFCQVDDYDIMASVKIWSQHTDAVLHKLCTMLLNRKLYKIKYTTKEQITQEVYDMQQSLQNIGSEVEASYFVFAGSVKNTLYKTDDEKINILFKDGSVKDISQVDNALVQQKLAAAEEKHYICYIKE
jgi:hypothetical protein